ncbi:hypothetical protein E1B28_010663 [Marasmius oreades]|uniref:Uncharacterized protein n=1 Tax=Marasmius oreades TaxID=181124 RepID=A0A9P7RY88_9AGAR|nr:uncharacterized protein E1B28_010663 [Marasmius oreades]KAG7091642.1 hypothetical protein E1B28_010663 [Marasmius oreades]
MEVHGLKENMHASVVRKTQEKMLQECLISGGMASSIDLSNLMAAPVKWNSTELSLPIPTSIVKEVLWELFEINFRFELVTLDRICYQMEASFHDHEVMVIRTMLYFRYSMIPHSLEQGKMGFSSKDLNIASGH